MAANVAVCDGAYDVSGVCQGAITSYPYILPFNPSQLEPLLMMEYFSAGFVIVGSIMLVIWAFKRVVKITFPK